MSTRFYFQNAVPAVEPPGSSTFGWDDDSTTIYRVMDTVKTGSNVNLNAASSSATIGWEVLGGRFVSPPVISAGSLTGNMTLVIACQQFGGALFGRVALGIARNGAYLSYNSGGNILGITTTNTAISTTYSLTSVNMIPGDRFVLELGIYDNNSSTSVTTLVFRYGGTGSDLVGGQTTNLTVDAAHLTFDSTVVDNLFLPEPGRGLMASA